MLAHNSILSDGTLHSVMRFNSQKQRRENQISIFSALKSRVWSFFCADFFKHRSQAERRESTSFRYEKIRTGYMQLFALFCVTFVTLSITSFVESNISSHRETDTLHIIPSHVKSDVWIVTEA